MDLCVLEVEGKRGPVLTQFFQTIPYPSLGSLLFRVPVQYPSLTAPDTLPSLPLPRWDSHTQCSRPVGCQALAEVLDNPELVGREGSVSLLWGLWVTLSPCKVSQRWSVRPAAGPTPCPGIQVVLTSLDSLVPCWLSPAASVSFCSSCWPGIFVGR